MANNAYIELTNILYYYYDEFNKKYFEGKLEPVVITIQSKGKSNSFGWFTTDKRWTTKDEENPQQYNEINISAEHLNRPLANVLSTLLHEMCHKYAKQNGIEDTTKNGIYHNKKFKELAEKCDLIIDYNRIIGHSLTTPSETLINYIKGSKYANDFNLYRLETKQTGGTEKPKKPKKPSYTFECFACGGKVKGSQSLMLICCGEPMNVEEK